MAYLRVRDKSTGHEYSIRARHFNDEAHERLDKDPLGLDGLPRPPKYRVRLGEAPAPSAEPSAPARTHGFLGGRYAKARPLPDPVTPDPDADGGEPEPDDGHQAESEQEND